jgi:2-iminobutanoate/2-iminopropanoate deaminase
VNLKNLVEDNGMTLEQNAVKNVLYLVDMKDFTSVNDIYKKYFTGNYPARTCVAVKELPKGAKVEIESILFKSN